MSEKLLVINCAALSPRALEKLRGLSSFMDGFLSKAETVFLKPVFPAVTMPVQASFLTGKYPDEHGCVSNSRLDRRTLKHDCWEQSALLLDAKPFWHSKKFEGKKVSTICWQFSFYNGADFVVTPAPIHARDGSTISALYTEPEELGEILVGEFGEFPLKNYWGPFAGPESTDWIMRATSYIMLDYSPDVVLTYFPYLDYVFQRHRLEDAAVDEALKRFGKFLEKIVHFGLRKGYQVMVVSEYGITPVDNAVMINRRLRELGFLKVRTPRGYEMLDPWRSTAWALVDHQVAHVFVNDRNRLNEVAKALRETDGIADVINRRRQPNFRVKHPNAGELIAVAEPRFWFSYHYWLDPALMPPFARTVDIHSKLGYDPLELFFNKNTMSIETANHTLVRGSHGRLPEDPLDGGVLITTAPVLKKTETESVEAVKVPEIISRIVV